MKAEKKTKTATAARLGGLSLGNGVSGKAKQEGRQGVCLLALCNHSRAIRRFAKAESSYGPVTSFEVLVKVLVWSIIQTSTEESVSIFPLASAENRVIVAVVTLYA